METFLHPLKKHLFAWGLRRLDSIMARAYGPRKKDLFDGLSGTVLEIGPGSGINFRYYPEGAHVVAVEPNRYLHPYLRQAAARYHLHLELHGALAETLTLRDDSIETAVSTLVLCSVTRPAEVLSEIRRVLKPGGLFLFLEHVAAPENSRTLSAQHAVRPLWGWLFDGCRPDRKTPGYLEQAGFSDLHIDRFNLSVPVVSPHIYGVAVK